jgi:hypothetical protein
MELWNQNREKWNRPIFNLIHLVTSVTTAVAVIEECCLLGCSTV